MSEYIEKLTEAISAVHEYRCSHFGTEHIKEEHKGEIVWECDVEKFHLHETAHDAVKAAIVSGRFE